jgi:hypothetical protein
VSGFCWFSCVADTAGYMSVYIATNSFLQGNITAMGLETQLRKRLARSQTDSVQRSQEAGGAAPWSQQGLDTAGLPNSTHISDLAADSTPHLE